MYRLHVTTNAGAFSIVLVMLSQTVSVYKTIIYTFRFWLWDQMIWKLCIGEVQLTVKLENWKQLKKIWKKHRNLILEVSFSLLSAT